MKELKNAIELSLKGLTDFQLSTVNALVVHFNDIDEISQRQLVADEVGLGKTIIARGLIAKLLLQALNNAEEERPTLFRVTYICSNRALAEENGKKLSIFRDDIAQRYVQSPSYGRLAEIALSPAVPAQGKILEICTLTPATSFTLTHGDGNARERYIIFTALAAHPILAFVEDWLSDFFSKDVQSWGSLRDGFRSERLVDEIVSDFHSSLRHPIELRKNDIDVLKDLGINCDGWISLLSDLAKAGEIDSTLQTRIRTGLRILFVRSCAQNLSADLFILDEFQRFRDLIDVDQENEQSIIARQVFTKKNKSKVLLLSATPFKALTHIDDEGEKGAHLEEFRVLLKFLAGNESGRVERYEAAREKLFAQILRLRDRSTHIADLDHKPKEQVEAELRPLICRTERSQISSDVHDLIEANHIKCDEALSLGEINNFIALDKLGQAVCKADSSVVVHQLMNFHKSAPWPLSFIGGYQFKAKLDRYQDTPEVSAARKASRDAWLPHKEMVNYRLNLKKAVPHSKFSRLLDKVFGDGGEKLLWIPPSLPYYEHHGPFKNQQNFTKTLLFSELVLAPRALSGLLSYEAEFRLFGPRSKAKYFGDRKIRPTIRFDGPGGLAPWALIYPCKVLSSISLRPTAGTLQNLKSEIKEILRPRVEALRRHISDSKENDKRWFALAPFLLDADLRVEPGVAGRDPHLERWLCLGDLTSNQDNSATGRTSQHKVLVDILRSDQIFLGEMPEDLPDYLTALAIAGPAVCLCRTLANTWGGNPDDYAQLATKGAYAILNLFNAAEAQRILMRSIASNTSWRQALEYCVAGNMQAMLDEYYHLLKADLSPVKSVERMASVLGLRTVPVSAQCFERNKKDVKLRCHFAVALGNQKFTDEKGIARVSNVRDAFNSPFWPFSLNSTSIGQEGLDFHWYCSRVTHWSLPSNPIDLEQREGRVNRYKSLVVRRRLAEQYGPRLLSLWRLDTNTWQQLFEHAEHLTRGKRPSDLIPFWHIPNGSARIERFVPTLPMSRESARLDELLRILSLYRLAFGQPRQQELLEFLLKRDDLGKVEEMGDIEKKLLVDLAPINYGR